MGVYCKIGRCVVVIGAITSITIYWLQLNGTRPVFYDDISEFKA